MPCEVVDAEAHLSLLSNALRAFFTGKQRVRVMPASLQKNMYNTQRLVMILILLIMEYILGQTRQFSLLAILLLLTIQDKTGEFWRRFESAPLDLHRKIRCIKQSRLGSLPFSTLPK